MRILFMGTPDIAAVMLDALAREQTVVGVFCQPDKPVGRKAVLTAPPVKQLAQRLGIPVFQPTRLRDGAAAAKIRELNPDLIAVVAYGRILPREILEIPPKGCVNIHASLLPEYRGAAPVQTALLKGASLTGVTAMYMDEGLDTGDIIEASSCRITDDDDAVTLFDRLGKIGAGLLCRTVSAIEKGTAGRRSQPEEGVSFAPPFTRESGKFSWNESARDIFNKARALCIWPNAYFEYEGKKIKLMKARSVARTGNPGEILALDPLTVAAGDEAVELLEVKPEGSRQMRGSEWAAGRRFRTGDNLLKNVEE